MLHPRTTEHLKVITLLGARSVPLAVEYAPQCLAQSGAQADREYVFGARQPRRFHTDVGEATVFLLKRMVNGFRIVQSVRVPTRVRSRHVVDPDDVTLANAV